MTGDEVARFFTRADGSYHFARWGRPIVPVVFGVDDRTLAVVKGAIEAVVTLAGHRMAETDPEQGANLMVFFLRNWAELTEVPGLDGLVPGLAALVGRLQAAGANQYRAFRFEAGGAIRAGFVFLRMDAALAGMDAGALALAQAALMMLDWAEGAFAGSSPLGRDGARLVLRPEIAAIIRAGYGPAMPEAAQDPSHALRLAARIG